VPNDNSIERGEGSMKFFFSTPVWGSGHIELFQKIGLPSLLAAGNLPAMAESGDCHYYIYTREQDVEFLTNCAAYERLTALMPVHIELIAKPIEVPHHTMSEGHADTLRRADEADAAAVFLPPDCVWADGSLANLVKHVKAGKSVVHMTGVRLNRDTALPGLLEQAGEDSALALEPQKLVAYGLDHFHPIALSHFWNEYEGGLLPANLYWTVPGEGLVIRCFHLHPLMVKSQMKGARFNGTIDDDLALSVCPDVSRDYIVTDSDEILAFELSAPTHQAGAPFQNGQIECIAAWAEVGTNLRHRELAMHTIRMHSKPMTRSAWSSVERGADVVMNEALRINRRWTPLLALTNPKVLAWRGYAMSLGRGAYLGQRRWMMTVVRDILKRRVQWSKALPFSFPR
jgi:hypothetical protein